MISSPSLSLTLLLSLAASAAAQGLVRDLRQVPLASTGDAEPASFVDAGPLAFFSAATYGAGREPCVTDLSVAGTQRIVELIPGVQDARAEPLCAIGFGEALFAYHLPGVGAQLLRTDGTAAGTTRLGALGINTPGERQFEAVRLANGRILLTALEAGAAPTRTYATDLTAAGTVAVPGMVGFRALTEFGGFTYGVALDGQFWRTDGTVAGSTVLTDGAVGPAVPELPPTATVWNGRVWFWKKSGTALQMWSTDGTVAGTRFEVTLTGFGPPNFFTGPFAVGPRLCWFQFGQLWSSDGTPAGSQPVANMPCNTIAYPTLFQGRIYMAAVGGNFGSELWSTDGTAAGTTMVADFVPGGGNSTPRQLVVSGANLYCTLQVGGVTQLAVCSGPQSLQTLGPIAEFAARTPFAGGVLFRSSDAAAGSEPWFASATQPPARVADLHVARPGSAIQAAARGRDRLYFVADDGVVGREVWSSDGTALGTRVVDYSSGPASSSRGSVQMVEFGDRVALATFDPVLQVVAGRVMVADGTLAGTAALPAVVSQFVAPSLAVRGDELFFAADDGIYHSDGTPAGTIRYPVSPILTRPDRLYALGGGLALVYEHFQILATDGFVTSLLSSGPDRVLGQIGERLLFVDQRGLVSTDGTFFGTVVLQAQAEPIDLVAQGRDRIVIVADGVVCDTDGGPGGVRTLAQVPAGLEIVQILVGATKTYLIADAASSGRELWRVDPIAGVVNLVLDLMPGSDSGVQQAWLCGDGDLLFLAASNGSDGSEPYLSDGSAAGTVRLADLHPGTGSSNPHFLGIAGGSVFFRADDGVVGDELWQVPLGTAAAASVQTLRAGCLGSNGPLALTAPQAPQLGNWQFRYSLTNARAGALAALLVGTQLGDQSLLGCRVLPSGATANLLGFFTSAVGSIDFQVPIPLSPAFVGVSLTTQAFALDAQVPNGFAGSNGVLAVIGR
jgi:ELWxxDGT repeat protein